MESIGGWLQWPSQTFPDHARLPPTVFTTTEWPPNDLWRPLNVPTQPTFIPDHSRLFRTLQNSREHLDRVHRPLRTLPDQPTPIADLPQTLHDLSRPSRSGQVGCDTASTPSMCTEEQTHLCELHAQMENQRCGYKILVTVWISSVFNKKA